MKKIIAILVFLVVCYLIGNKNKEREDNNKYGYPFFLQYDQTNSSIFDFDG